MQLTEGDIFWIEKNGVKNTYSYLTKNIKCDVIIVGGGITSAITAYYLAKEGMNVVIVEKNIIGFGTTLSATAFLDYAVDMDLNRLDKKLGKRSSRRLYELCLEAIYEIENIDKEIGKKTEFKKRDSIYFTNKLMQKGYIIKECDARKKAGFNAEIIDENDTINLSSGIITKNAGADIDPYKFTVELFEYLSKLDNVRIYENTEVKNINCSYENVECITNNKFKIKSNKLIFANGIEGLKYIKTNIVELYKTFSIVTKPINKFSKVDTSFIAKDMCDPYHYIRFTKEGRIIINGEDIKLSAKMSNEKHLRSISKDKYYKLYCYLKKTFKSIDSIEVEFEYNCTFANTSDSLSIIDEIEDMPNCYCNLGFGSNGILFSVIGAKFLKDAVKGLYNKDMKMFSIKRN